MHWRIPPATTQSNYIPLNVGLFLPLSSMCNAVDEAVNHDHLQELWSLFSCSLKTQVSASMALNELPWPRSKPCLKAAISCV